MRWIGKIDRGLARLETALLAVVLLCMIVLAAAQVVLRNIWDTGIDWADPLLQHATVLVGLLGAAVATSEGRHLSIDVLSRLLHGRWRLMLRVTLDAFGLGIALLLVRGGWTAFASLYGPWVDNLPPGWSVARTLRSALAEGMFPPWVVQLMLPAGLGLIALHFALRVACELTELISTSPDDAGGAAGEGNAGAAGEGGLPPHERTGA